MRKQMDELNAVEQEALRHFLRVVVEKAPPEFRAALAEATSDERSVVRVIAEMAFQYGRSIERARAALGATTPDHSCAEGEGGA